MHILFDQQKAMLCPRDGESPVCSLNLAVHCSGVESP